MPLQEEIIKTQTYLEKEQVRATAQKNTKEHLQHSSHEHESLETETGNEFSLESKVMWIDAVQ